MSTVLALVREGKHALVNPEALGLPATSGQTIRVVERGRRNLTEALLGGMAELVLRDAKWNAVSLGDNLPFETLAAVIKEQQPKLFWLSCSHIANEAEFLNGYGERYNQFGMNVAFVVGGYALTDQLRQKMKFSSYCDNMQHVEGFAQKLRSAIGE